MARKPYRARIGSVSTGTHRNEDLICAFVDEIAGSKLSKAHRKLVREANAWLDTAERDQSEGHELVNELFCALNELAPPYTYFGSLDGDGADFGFWPSLSTVNDDKGSDDLPFADKVPKNYTGLAIDVNDHGNVTLFRYVRGKRSIVWDCV